MLETSASLTFYGGNVRVSLPHRRGTTVSLQTKPFIRLLLLRFRFQVWTT